MSSHSITSQESHTVSYWGIYSVCTKKQCYGGKDVQCRVSKEETEGHRTRGEKAGAYLHASRVQDWNRPMKLGLSALAITMTTGYNINHSAHCSLFDFSV